MIVNGLDFTLFKKVKGFEEDLSNIYLTRKERIPVEKFVALDFNCDSLYDFQNASSLICEDDETDICSFLNDKRAEYLIIYKYGTDEQIIIPYKEKDLAEMLGVNIKKRTGIEGFLINTRLCYSNQQFEIDEVNKIVEKIKNSRGRKKKTA